METRSRGFEKGDTPLFRLLKLPTRRTTCAAGCRCETGCLIDRGYLRRLLVVVFGATVPSHTSFLRDAAVFPPDTRRPLRSCRDTRQREGNGFSLRHRL